MSGYDDELEQARASLLKSCEETLRKIEAKKLKRKDGGIDLTAALEGDPVIFHDGLCAEIEKSLPKEGGPKEGRRFKEDDEFLLD